MTDEATNLGDGEAAADDLTQGVDDPNEGSDENLDLDQGDGEGGEDAGDDDQPAEEVEEIEHDGKKFTIPKALKPALMMQADYTRKTQELAETRKALDAERAQQATASEEVLTQRALAIGLKARLAEYDQVDWAALRQQNPDQFNELRWQHQDVKDALSAATAKVTEAEQAQALEAQRQHATRLQEGQAELARDIQGWSPELAGKLATFAQKEIGFTSEELAQATDPRLIKLLHRAYVGTTKAAQQSKAQAVQQAQKTAPAKTLRGASGQFKAAPDTSDFGAFDKMADGILAKG